jgi:methylated-DNA-[protein]-cysteine S-methyltransferase
VVPNSILKKMKMYPAFQQKVWRACAEIPAGETRTYGWIATKIGLPSAARAVGTALGKNPFAPIIPCHRVLRSDGSMGGYSAPGGIQKKLEMLREEGARLK